MNNFSVITIYSFVIEFLNNNLSITISLCALFLSFYQGYLSRNHFKLSVRPKLAFLKNRTIDGDVSKGYEIILSNQGLGPAIIKKYSICINKEWKTITSGKEFKDLFEIHFKGTIDWENSKNIFFMKDAVFGKGEEMLLICIIPKYNTREDIIEFSKNIKSINFKIDYESFYKTKDTLTSKPN